MDLTVADASALRRAFGRFATGVTIVTCRAPDGTPVGLTANSFASLSLKPPLVLWSLRASSPSVEPFLRATGFAVNVLAQSQVDLSRRFASTVANRFEAGTWNEGLDSLPVLAGCAAVFECRRVSHQDAGDHVLFIGQVLRMQEQPLAPLVFQGGHYRGLGDLL